MRKSYIKKLNKYIKIPLKTEQTVIYCSVNQFFLNTTDKREGKTAEKNQHNGNDQDTYIVLISISAHAKITQQEASGIKELRRHILKRPDGNN